MKSLFYSKIVKNINPQFKKFLLKNTEFKLLFNKIAELNITTVSNIDEKFYRKIQNGSSFILAINDSDMNDNFILYYKNTKVNLFHYQKGFLDVIKCSDIISLTSNFLTLNLEKKRYTFYDIKYINIENYYNNKINKIHDEYKLRLNSTFYNYLEKYLTETKNTIKKEVSDLVLNSEINKYSDDKFIINNTKYLGELVSDISEINFILSIFKKEKFNEILRNIVDYYKTKNFSKFKDIYYEELNTKKELYYRRLIKYIFEEYLPFRITYIKYKKYKEYIVKNPSLYKEFKNIIHDNKLALEFDYLENANQFDML